MTTGGAMTMAGGRRGFTVAQAGVVLVVSWIVALATVLTLASEPWRSSLLVGVVTSIFSGVAGLVLASMSEGRSLNAALLGRVVGFLLRIVLVAIGLVTTIRGLHSEPLGFVFGYFPLFFLSTVLEQIIAARSGPVAPPKNDVGGGAR